MFLPPALPLILTVLVVKLLLFKPQQVLIVDDVC